MDADELRKLSQKATSLASQRESQKADERKREQLQRRRDQVQAIIDHLPEILANAAKTGSRKVDLLVLESDEIQSEQAYRRGFWGQKIRIPGCSVIVSFSDHVQALMDACSRLGIKTSLENSENTRVGARTGGIGNNTVTASW